MSKVELSELKENPLENKKNKVGQKKDYQEKSGEICAKIPIIDEMWAQMVGFRKLAFKKKQKQRNFDKK